MCEESIKPPALYPTDFGTTLTTILYNTYGLTPEAISHDNCCTIYLSLVRLVDMLLDSDEVIWTSLDEVNKDSDSDTECDSDSD